MLRSTTFAKSKPIVNFVKFSTQNNDAVIDFNKAYKSKSIGELLRSYLVFKTCQIPIIVKNSEKLVKFSYKVLGNKITNTALNHTFFGHFCGGEDISSLKPKIQYLESNGVGSILDYAAESDIAETPEAAPVTANNAKPNNVQCRIYDYKNEELCDNHYKTFDKCIRAVSSVSPTGFAAIKVTALGNPELLKKVSNLIVQLRNLFLKFDQNQSGLVTREQFTEGYNKFFKSGDMEKLFETLDKDKNGMVDYIEWTNGLKLEELHLLTAHCKETGPLANAVLNEEERELLKRMRERIDNLASLAQTLGVRLMIDAEHTYFQPAIDLITIELMKKYNKKFPAIFGTYQMYLKDSRQRLHLDINRAKKGDYKFSAKLVRGAYMVLERAHAKENNLPDPIHNTIEDTHNNYNGGVDDVLQTMADGYDFEFMIASHNQNSVESALANMKKRGLPPSKGVYFGQLLGMSDHLTFSLGAGGYKAYKYVPYGIIHEVMPYLIRRAQENSDALGGAKTELKLIKAELKRRYGG